MRNSYVLLDSEGFDKIALRVSNCLLEGLLLEFEMAKLSLESPLVPFERISMCV